MSTMTAAATISPEAQGERALGPNQRELIASCLYYTYKWVSGESLRAARRLEARGLVRVEIDSFFSYRAYITDLGREVAAVQNIQPRGWVINDTRGPA